MRRLSLILALSISVTNSSSGDWPQFRGINSAGHSNSGSVPVEFGPGKNELWRIPLESGHSSPCVAGDSLFVTTFNRETQELKLLCIDRHQGKLRWDRLIQTEEIEKGHPSFNPASSTPASDGQCVVAYFGSFGLICFDMDGKKRWERKMPLTKSYAGNATSPVISGDRVFLYRGNFVDHFLLAVNKHTGDEVWRVEQDEPFDAELACTACPIVVDDKLIVHTARSVQAFGLDTGALIWITKCATTATSTPVIADGDVIVAAWNKMGEPALRPEFPSYETLVEQHDQDNDHFVSQDEFPQLWIFHRPEGAEAPENGAPLGFRSIDTNHDQKIDAVEWNTKLRQIEKFRSGYKQHGLLAIPIDSKGVIDSHNIRTLERQGIPEVPSPLYHDGIVYLLKNGGVLTCIDAHAAKRIAKVRTLGKGTHYASPIIADGKLFATAGDGQISVLSLGARPRVLSVNNMGEATYATPAAVDGKLYVRTHAHLYAFGD